MYRMNESVCYFFLVFCRYFSNFYCSCYLLVNIFFVYFVFQRVQRNLQKHGFDMINVVSKNVKAILEVTLMWAIAGFIDTH